jgi:sugar phosphate isomerase/epimerase
MQNTRRDFVKNVSIMAGAATLLPQLACSSKISTNAFGGNLEKFGIQLYTLREDMPKDPKGVLKHLSNYGYTQIEGYEGPQGLFWNMTPKDYKNYLADLGMEMIASHCRYQENFQAKAAQAAEAGMKYLICPYVGPQTSMDNWKKITDSFNAAGKICKENGIRFAYHNHEYSFKPFSGMIPHNFIMENTDPDLVDHEMDIYWVVTGEADPVAFLTKYKNRFRLCHVKDRIKGETKREASCDLGKGFINYPSILNTARKMGMQYYIVEQERYDNTTPLKCAETNADYLKKLKFV